MLNPILRSAALAFVSLAIASSASAYTIVDLGRDAGSMDLYGVKLDASDEGGSFAVDWGLADPVLSADATFTIRSYADDEIVLDIVLNNTTDPLDSKLAYATVMSMGFGVIPDVAVTMLHAGSVFDQVGNAADSNDRLRKGFRQIDVCLYADHCGGGFARNGLQAGESDKIQLSLTPLAQDFASGAGFAFFPIKFQTSAGPFAIAGVPRDVSTAPTPEPAAAVVFATGFLVVSAAVRRRRH